MPALEDAPRGLGTRVSLRPPGRSDRALGADVTDQSIWASSRAGRQGRSIDAGRANAVAKPQQAMIRKEAKYWAAQELLEEGDGPDIFPGTLDVRAPGQAERQSTHAFDHLLRMAGHERQRRSAFLPNGRQDERTAADATAFAHRNSDWIMDVGLTGAPRSGHMVQSRTSRLAGPVLRRDAGIHDRRGLPELRGSIATGLAHGLLSRQSGAASAHKEKDRSGSHLRLPASDLGRRRQRRRPNRGRIVERTLD